MSTGEQLKFLSANCQGLRDKIKRLDVWNYLLKFNPNVICLQDTHLTPNDENQLKLMSNCHCLISGKKTNARGVAILLRNNFAYKITNSFSDNDGNYQYLDMELATMTLRLINIYAPNSDTPTFFQSIETLVLENTCDHLILCGDFNLVMDPIKDSFNYVSINNPRSRSVLLETMRIHNLIDTFRFFHPNVKRYTWRRRNPIKQARLDHFIVSHCFNDLISRCKIAPGYRSDHSIHEVSVQISNFRTGKGLWKLNCDLLKHQDYITLVNETIKNTRLDYVPRVYNPAFLEDASDLDLSFTTNIDIVLEMILFKVRQATIRYASTLKRTRNSQEKALLKEIEQLEDSPESEQITNKLEKLKYDLETLRDIKLKGQVIRSRAQWLQSGEKPSQYFCNLEQKNFLDKTIRKIILENGDIITTQGEILNEIKEYYSNLFENRDTKLEAVNLNELLNQEIVTKLSVDQSNSIEGPIQLNELSYALKNMKNNKTPGIDGFSVEFFKVFWRQLKYLILRVANFCFEQGKLSISMRQSVINCIPKGDKPRQFLKNWRPISLLCVLYKLISTVIANRLKKVLDTLISKTQTGFISGRNIGESIRLIYDLMSFAEKQKITGLLMLIDFEKAFDSVSWKFMYNTLQFYGFGKDFIRWIEILNTDIHASVIQAGVKSEFFPIKRGCKQGDPIASYLFLLCGQILYYLICQNKDIKGLLVDKEEIKLSQFADDTTIILDGSCKSLEAALNVIEIFGNMSGLKMNTSKTKVIWIGDKRHSSEKLPIRYKLEWGTTVFNLLGVQFSVNLNDMPDLNYLSILDKSKKVINNWNKRSLTPLGKITIIKTFIISNFNYLFSAIPSPDKTFLKNLNRLLFNYLWDNKPDKICRTCVIQDYRDFGLRMVDLTSHISALKLVWLNKLLKTIVTLFVK